MSDELKAEEQENYIEEMAKRYLGLMNGPDVCNELLENESLGRELYKRKIMREFDSDSTRDPSISPSIKKILRKALEYDVDNIADITEMPAVKKKYKEAKIYFENHRASKEEKEMYPDMIESDENEAERIMQLYNGTFQGMPGTMNTML